MNPKKTNRLIADLCGTDKFFVLKKRGLYYRHKAAGYTDRISEAGLFSESEACRLEYPHDEPVTKHPAPIPNYHGDLNACAEFERDLLAQSYINKRTTPFHIYFEKLHQICVLPSDTFNIPMQTEHWAVCATAPQRCLAFIRTVAPQREKEIY